MNVVVLRGRLSSPPVARALASGSALLSLEVTTETASGSISVPVAWFDPPLAPAWGPGAEVVVRGVAKRRFYRAGGTTQSRTEVIPTEVVEASKRKAVERLIARATSELAGEIPQPSVPTLPSSSKESTRRSTKVVSPARNQTRGS